VSHNWSYFSSSRPREELRACGGLLAYLEIPLKHDEFKLTELEERKLTDDVHLHRMHKPVRSLTWHSIDLNQLSRADKN